MASLLWQVSTSGDCDSCSSDFAHAIKDHSTVQTHLAPQVLQFQKRNYAYMPRGMNTYLEVALGKKTLGGPPRWKKLKNPVGFLELSVPEDSKN